jgi:menaquinone-9 beta-reductase
MTTSARFDVAIAGAGPAGASAAIHLALKGAQVLLVEAKKFPRAKLCGEFISPECLEHFNRLGVNEQMLSAGGAAITKTVFYARRGQNVEVPSEWFASGASALGLSRAEMDHQLLERAKAVGVTVLEEAHASGLIIEKGRVRGLKLKTAETLAAYEATITIDATGRARALTRYLENVLVERSAQTKRALVAFKVHLENARLAEGACEIYCYPGGYGGLSFVEHGLSNLCFIVAARDVRTVGSNPETVLREIVMQNTRAADTLRIARSHSPWLSVSLEGFGRRLPAPAPGLLTIGDAAAFIDPFTGSGMLMALESGEVAATVVNDHLGPSRNGERFTELAMEYGAAYTQKFKSRLRIAGFLRRAAFVPGMAEAAIFLARSSTRLRRKVAQATRPTTGGKRNSGQRTIH